MQLPEAPSKGTRRRLAAIAHSLGAPSDYYTAADARSFPGWAADEMAPYFMALQPLKPEEFFTGVLANWEYDLLHDADDAVGWPGMLALVRAGIPFDYTRKLNVHYEKAEARDTLRYRYGYGYAEVIRLYEAGVPVEYALSMLSTTEAAHVIEAYAAGLPAEYASALG